MFDYLDIHSHLYFPDFDIDREEEIAKLKEQKIGAITVGTDFDSSEKAIELAEKYENLFATVGQHPGNIKLDDTPYDISYGVEKLAEHKKVVAIGECGLDYFRPSENFDEIKKIQKRIFRQHIDLALKLNKPLMLHIRPSKARLLPIREGGQGTMDAYLDALDILENQKNIHRGLASVNKIHGVTLYKLRGNVHFFVGDLDILKRFLDIGFTVSFTGVITFTHDYDEVVRATPPDMMMSETDAPFVAPVPYRGKRNSPLYVKEVVKKIAEIRSEDFEIVRKQMVSNANRVFGL